ncbi:unnamed protein product, partial [Mesorhabditis belari]|uniref:VWFA domain-containing protein n=1 Tax=Mesorhabditis belari TaxID=2138241 RepID=A0AAF3EN37_9BILA
MISIKEPNTTMIYAPSPNSSTRSKELCVDMSDLTKNSVDVGQAIIQATQGIVPDRFKCFADSTTGSASSTTSTSKATTKAFTTNMITTTNNMGTTGGIIETTTEASQTTENMQTSSESTETTSTSTRNDETTTTTSTSCYGVQPNECSCEPTSLWNDLVVVIDRSNEIGEKDFDATVSAIKTILFGTSIGQRDENETQLGVVLYDLKAQLVADLTEYKNRDDMMKAKWPYSGGDGTNLADGLDMAIDILAADMRSASRQVILLITSVYHWQDGFEDPIKAATGFKDDGGLIITLGIGGLHGKVNETLRNVSSPGFFIQLKSINSLTENTTRDEIYRLFCDANCFCPGQLDEITEDRFSPVSTTQRESVPDGGCFFDSSLPSSQILVERTCKTMEVAVNKSMTAMPKYSNQQAHILRAQQFNITYWVALNSTNGFWKWNDGTAFCGAEVQFDDKSPADAHYAVLQWTDDGELSLVLLIYSVPRCNRL